MTPRRFGRDDNREPIPFRTLSAVVVAAMSVTLIVLVTGWAIESTRPEAGPDRVPPAPPQEQSSPASEPVVEPAAAPRPHSARAWLALPRRHSSLMPGPGDLAFVSGDSRQRGWADLYAEPDGRGERLGQALLGDRVHVIEQQGDWSRVRTAGLESAWLDTTYLTSGSEAVRERWRSPSLVFVVEAPGLEVSGGPFLPFGARLALQDDKEEEEHFVLLLPDGRTVHLDRGLRAAVSPRLPLSEALERTKAFRRVPYQVGANTRAAMDGPGLVYLVNRVTGRPVPRRLAKLQQAGEEVDLEVARPGDVCFYSTFDENLPQPVLLLDGAETYLTASPASGVSLGLISQLKNRRLLTVRRYASSRKP